jgi:putative endopeptidase
MLNKKTNDEYTPQSNFYLWANNKWLNDPSNKIPDEYTSWGSFDKLGDKSLKNQIIILDNLKNKLIIGDKLSDDGRKIAIIYQKIMAKFYDWENEKGNYDAIKNEFTNMEKILSGQNYIKILGEYGSYCIKNEIRFFINIEQNNDLKNSDDIKLCISPGAFLFPSIEYYFDNNFKKQRKYFKKHLENVKNIMEQNEIKLCDNFVENILEIEKFIASINMTNAQCRLYDEYYTKTTLTDFYQNIDFLHYVKDKLNNYDDNNKDILLNNHEKEEFGVFMEEFYQHLNLRKHMKNNYEKTYNNTDNDDNIYTINVFDGDYMKRILKYIINTNNSEKITAYFQYNIIYTMNNYCTKELNDEFFDFYERKLHDQKEQKTYEKRATNIINIWVGDLMGKIYVKNSFSQESKEKINNMIDNVQNVMKESLEKNDWLTYETKNKSILKLEAFKKKIGYPDVWKNYDNLILNESDFLGDIRNKVKKFIYKNDFLNKINTRVNKDEWFISPQTVNAYYHPQLNEIVFPAAILQPPFYQNTYSDIDMDIEDLSYYEKLGFDPLIPINHGSIMAVIAHEITHGYDDQGRKFDNNGNMSDWWTQKDIELFTKKTIPMCKQVDKYQYIDNDNKIHKMNHQLTMGENLADLGGLTLALKALLNYTDKNNNKIYRHPESLKLFFRSWANIWKSKYTEQAKIQRLVSDPHAPVDFRGNLVKNIDEFYDVFNIKKGDKMFIEINERVKMW